MPTKIVLAIHIIYSVPLHVLEFEGSTVLALGITYCVDFLHAGIDFAYAIILLQKDLSTSTFDLVLYSAATISVYV